MQKTKWGTKADLPLKHQFKEMQTRGGVQVEDQSVGAVMSDKTLRRGEKAPGEHP